ncbi:hypothetical protein ISCGN_007234 [Ixodes scapularis]
MREDDIGAPVRYTLASSLRMKTPAMDIRTPTATAGFSGRGETAVNMSPNLLFLLVVQEVLGRSLTAAVGNKLLERAVSAKMTILPAIQNNASSSLLLARMREDDIGAPVRYTLASSLRMKTPAMDIRTPTATAGFSGRGETAVNMSPNLLFLLVVQEVLGRSLTAAVGNKLPERAVSAINDKTTGYPEQRIVITSTCTHARRRHRSTSQVHFSIEPRHEDASDGYKNANCHGRLQWARRNRREHDT